MITDLNQIGSVESLTTDICIIGSGAVGIALAREFIGTPHQVIILEAGAKSYEAKNQEPYKSEVVGMPHDGIHNGRVRVLGGTTTLWAGQSIPLWDIDFEKRDWVPLSGWPIGKQELQPYYTRAEDVLNVPHINFEIDCVPGREKAIPVYPGTGISTYISTFSPIPNFGIAYRSLIEEAKNIRLLTHANAVALNANPTASAVNSVAVKTFQGKQINVAAKVFIVCCGGIESARLLLASDSVEPGGIGNRHDVVGRYFQDHPGVAIPVRPLDTKRFGLWYDSFRLDGIRHCIKFAASPQLQREKQILHVGGEVFYPISFAFTAAKMVLGSVAGMFKRKPRDETPAPQVKSSTGPSDIQVNSRGQMFQSLASVAQKLDTVGKTAFFRQYVLGKAATMAAVQPHVGFASEQEPNPASRITLSKERDSLGMRRSILDWQLTPNEARSIDTFARTLAAEWEKAGLAKFNPDDLKLDARSRGELGGYIDASHHIGATRMGVDPATSVVDPSCKVHGYDNLYIGSSSVFPTGGFSNPTLTLLALCLKMADQIKSRLGSGELQPVGTSSMGR